MTIPRDKVAIVEKMVKQCVKHLRKKKYELNIPKSALEDCILDLNVYKRRRGLSSAGFREININVNCWQFNNNGWCEYKAFHDDPVIGYIEVNDNLDILLCLVAHEVSHYVQYTYRNWFPEYMKKDYRKPHGRTFQKIYRYLRADLVNPTIEARRKELKESVA